MAKWMERAARLEAEAAAGANRANSANSSSKTADVIPIGPIGPIGSGSLPASVRSGLALLRGMSAPPVTNPAVWPGIVADALRLAADPDVAEVLTKGWHPLHFWGCCPSAEADPGLEGLAIRLMGRKPLIYDTHAIMESAAATHSVFTPRSVDGAIFLWELGRNRDGR